jgi:serine phosphatase RsbU (regulator of sigma subunit)
VLEHLDTFVAQVEPARFATLAYAEIDPATGRATYACAGHLPPVLLDPPAAPELLMGGRSTPLGVAIEAVARTEAEVTLRPGAGLLLYTDGLVERRGEMIDTALDRLVATVAVHAATPRDQLGGVLARELLVQGVDDDVCLLVFTLSPRAA